MERIRPGRFPLSYVLLHSARVGEGHPRTLLETKSQGEGVDITLSPMIDTVTFPETIAYRLYTNAATTMIEKSFVLRCAHCILFFIFP